MGREPWQEREGRRKEERRRQEGGEEKRERIRGETPGDTESGFVGGPEREIKACPEYSFGKGRGKRYRNDSPEHWRRPELEKHLILHTVTGSVCISDHVTVRYPPPQVKDYTG